MLKNLLDYRFPGRIYPVNPKASEILGLPCYPRETEIPEEVDLAVIAFPASAVPSVLEDCAVQGIRAAVILSAGFRKSGAEGGPLFVLAGRVGFFSQSGALCLAVLEWARRTIPIPRPARWNNSPA